ncbi:MAG: hypothetical protein ACREBN_06615, partial [Burkholderiaceae bacterium]
MQPLTQTETAAASTLLEGTNATGRIGSRIFRPTISFNFSPALAASAVMLAAIVGLLLPMPVVATMMREGGPIESATSGIYLVAIAALWHDFRRGEGPATRVALSVVLAGFLGRELDLHKTPNGLSLLKLSSYV